MTRHTIFSSAAIAACFGLSVALQAARDAQANARPEQSQYLYVSSPTAVKRLAGPYDTLAADLYWVRAIQHYGGTKLSTSATKRYDLLYPLLDITTTLDPKFNIAYRFGALFLAEAYPGGAGRPDLAVALLKKGVAAQPEKWQYLQDIGFVHYWWMDDYRGAAEWFRKASEIKGAPWWMKSLAATTLAQGGDRQSSRFLWRTIAQTATDNEWLQGEAEKRLLQLDALDQIDQLARVVQEYMRRTRAFPATWDAVVRAGLIREVPLDPAGTPFVLDARARSLSISTDSRLYPLPAEPAGVPSLPAASTAPSPVK